MMETDSNPTVQSSSEPLHTEETEVPVHVANCENCVLCTVSKKAHSWRNSSSVLWERAVAGVEYIRNGVSTRYHSFQESHPNSAGFIEETGRRIRALALVVSDRSVRAYHRGVSGVKNTLRASETAIDARFSGVLEPIKKHPLGCYFFVCIYLIVAVFLYDSPVGRDIYLFSMWLSVLGIFLLWVPLIITAYSDRHRIVEEHSSLKKKLLENPPEYSVLHPFSISVTHGVGQSQPPTYEEVLHRLHTPQPQSNSGIIQGVPMCPVHTTTAKSQIENLGTQQQLQNQQMRRILPLSKSMTNLHTDILLYPSVHRGGSLILDSPSNSRDSLMLPV